ncbi:MAG: M3 family oligoendopeptidase, partial [Erysipelotrichaceae bacterium]|nr:M3 family oligoendopeptidase [Erysipelotrichaceae bacterium]
VKVRTKIAKTLGYSSFTELAYLRMMRLDYDRNMVANYRKQILEDIVPAVFDLYKRQARRLGTEKVAYYDKGMEFLNGNPSPKGTKEELIKAAQKMYHEMSKETGEFIDVMVENDLWDLDSKDGKQMGGYCTSIPAYKVPFIFANFNGTSGDVDVLTHEAGHAFQYYLSKDIPTIDLQWPTMESAEIASMSMEFNAWPWVNLFFKEDTDKYKFLHLSGTLKFLPYGVLVDHFQHEVYDHTEWTADERKACWRRLEKMYQPYIDYEGAPLWEKGCWWYQQGHIFESPFYYIDYTLAQVCALQFWARNQKKDPKAWEDYVALCRLGGTKSFTGLVKAAHLKVPFEDGCLKDIAREADAYLGSVNDKAL